MKCRPSFWYQPFSKWFVTYSIENNNVYKKTNDWALWLSDRPDSMPFTEGSLSAHLVRDEKILDRVVKKLFGVSDIKISNGSKDVIWRDVGQANKVVALINNRLYKEHSDTASIKPEINQLDTTTPDQDVAYRELNVTPQDTVSVSDPVEDKWYEGYELLDELVHIPALPEKLWKMLVDRSGYTTPSAIKWLVNDGDYIKRGQVIGKLILYRHKRKSFIKPKEEDCIFDIKSPTYGKIKEYTGIKGTEYFKRKLSTLQERSSYDYVAPMFLVQKVRGPDMDYPVTSYSMELFVEGFNNACWSWLRHEDKTIEQGGRISLIDQMRRARIRSELISYETKYYELVEKDKKLESFACEIPFPSRLLMDAALHEKNIIEEHTHIKTGQWIEKGEKIASYKGYNKDVSIVSPITGKVIFCGLNSKILEDLHTSPSDYSAFGLWPDKDSVHNSHPQDFSDRYRYYKNLPVNLYDNKVYGVARNVVAIIQPEKGSEINPDSYVQEAFSEILKAARNYIHECYSSDQEYYETVIGQEIQKVEDCKGDFLGA